MTVCRKYLIFSLVLTILFTVFLAQKNIRIIKKIIIGIVLNGAALYAVTHFLDKVSYQGGWKFFLIGGLIIGILNTLVKPILKLFSLPLIIVTAGLFLLVINTVILIGTQYLINHFNFIGTQLLIEGKITYFVAALIFGVINWFEHLLIKH